MTVLFNKNKPFRHAAMIEGVILDNDGTLYKEPENAHDVHTEAAVLAVKSQPQMSFRSALEIEGLIDKSKKHYGGALEIFAEEYGMDGEQLRRDHYSNLIELTRQQDGYFDHADAPEQALTELKGAGVGLYIATHGNEEWTDYSLDRNRLSHLFSKAHDDVIHKDDVPGRPGKNQSPAMYAALLDKIGVPQTQNPAERGVNFAMVEDSVSNLKHAKALGMMTILVDTVGKVNVRKLPDYVDVVVRNRNDIAAVILGNNGLHHEEDLEQERAGWTLEGPEKQTPLHVRGHDHD
ncbi:MAG: HAD family hydrolase [Alphaproteobacteria bacterium]|nr:HAD family hydrolase [Alphaproteobacteria bacterium]QQS57689.1 MAG: HAD family hydrolase [Alphaproteobacteria bacterium]